MTARILVVDDVEANVKLLRARLMAEYFEVVTAVNGPDALKVCRAGQCDIVLLDVMMPGMDGYEVCRQLKADPQTAHLPVVMVTALDQPADKLEGLNAGADDFLTKPVADLPLLTRVRSLTRLKRITDELQMRVAGTADMGMGDISSAQVLDPQDGRNGTIMIVDDRASNANRSRDHLQAEHRIETFDDPHEALFRAADGAFDLCIVSLSSERFDPLRLCSQLRSLDRTRSLPILLISAADDEARLMRAIDFGVNDYIERPIEPNELMARVRTQVRRKRLNDKLRESVQSTMQLAVKDGLTGMNNRRYFERQFESLFNHASVSGKALSLIMVDIDHFKQINDTLGHQAGDEVLRNFSRRLLQNVRSKDLASRYGGEEFVIALPDTDEQLAAVVAERMRREIGANPVSVAGNAQPVTVTLSAGVASIQPEDGDISELIERADKALYDAKRAGRNRVMTRAA